MGVLLYLLIASLAVITMTAIFTRLNNADCDYVLEPFVFATKVLMVIVISAFILTCCLYIRAEWLTKMYNVGTGKDLLPEVFMYLGAAGGM